MATGTQYFNELEAQDTRKFVAHHGVEIIAPLTMEGFGQVCEIRILTGVNSPNLSENSTQVHRSIYADALFNENRLFQNHHNQEVYFETKSSSCLRENRIQPHALKTVRGSIVDIDEALNKKYVLRLFYMNLEECMADFNRAFHFLDANVTTDDMVRTIVEAVFGEELAPPHEYIEAPF